MNQEGPSLFIEAPGPQIAKDVSSSSSSSSKFISNHTDIVIHIVIYSIILNIQNIWCDLGYTQ